MHLLVRDGAILIQNIHHPYILILPLWHHQFSIRVHVHNCIFRLFHGKYFKINASKFTINGCLFYQLLLSHVQFSYPTIDKFGPVSSFLNKFWFINHTLLHIYNGFNCKEASIKYNHIYYIKDSLIKAEKNTLSSTLFIKTPSNQIWRVIISLQNTYIIHYVICTIRNRAIIVDIRMWLIRTKIPTRECSLSSPYGNGIISRGHIYWKKKLCVAFECNQNLPNRMKSITKWWNGFVSEP